MTPPKMPVHIGDYKRDTGHLRAAQHGAYLLLLFHHWSTGALPDDDDQLSAIACMSPVEWRKAKPIIEKFFKPGWVHGRVLDDLNKANEGYERRAKAGSKGGNARAMLKPEPSNATAMLKLPITDNLDKKEEDTADAVPSPKVYAFESGVIRLNTGDLEKWREAFSHLDLRAELLSLTEWAGQQPKWFFAVSAALAKRNREVKAASERAKAPGAEFKWNGIEGVV